MWIHEGAVVQTMGSLLKGEVRVALRIKGFERERGTEGHIVKEMRGRQCQWKLKEESFKGVNLPL